MSTKKGMPARARSRGRERSEERRVKSEESGSGSGSGTRRTPAEREVGGVSKALYPVGFQLGGHGHGHGHGHETRITDHGSRNAKRGQRNKRAKREESGSCVPLCVIISRSVGFRRRPRHVSHTNSSLTGWCSSTPVNRKFSPRNLKRNRRWSIPRHSSMVACTS